jgi:hypothetical protein
MELDYKYNDPADQITFTNVLTIIILQRTACLLFYLQWSPCWLPSKTDTPDKIEYDALTKRAQLAFTMAWELANRENRPVVDKPQI